MRQVAQDRSEMQEESKEESKREERDDLELQCEQVEHHCPCREAKQCIVPYSSAHVTPGPCTEDLAVQ